MEFGPHLLLAMIEGAVGAAVLSLMAVGLGLVFVPASALTYATLKPELRTEGASLFSLSRNLGSSVGISIMTSPACNGSIACKTAAASSGSTRVTASAKSSGRTSASSFLIRSLSGR